jgi:hypothetical protein
MAFSKHGDYYDRDSFSPLPLEGESREGFKQLATYIKDLRSKNQINDAAY